MSGVDRISNLPDEIILCIFSFLPSSKLRAKTSVLSKRWRQLWTLLPSIQIPVTAEGGAADVAGVNYAKAIVACIDSFNAGDLRRLSLDLWFPSSDPNCLHAMAADVILRFAAIRFVCEIRLRVPSHPSCEADPPIPESLYQSGQCIYYLNIDHGTFPEVPLDFQGFRYLKTLFLDYVKINNDTLGFLLGCCPVLERLGMVGCSGLLELMSLPSVWILPKLTDLTMFSCKGLLANHVEAPNLKYIKYESHLQFLHLTNSPALIEAGLKQYTGIALNTVDDVMRLLFSVSSVEVLAANSWFYQFVIPKPAMLNNLKELDLIIEEELTESVLRTLVTNIGGCSTLEILDIQFGYVPEVPLDDNTSLEFERHMDALREYSEECHKKDWFTSLELEPTCSFRHLKTVILRVFLGSKGEMCLVKFLLENGFALEKFVVVDFFDRGEELMEIFSLIPRASSQVQFKLSVVENLKLYGLYRLHWMEHDDEWPSSPSSYRFD